MGSHIHAAWDVGPSHRLLVDPQTWRANAGHNDERDERERGREDGRATDDGVVVCTRGVAIIVARRIAGALCVLTYSTVRSLLTPATRTVGGGRGWRYGREETTAVIFRIAHALMEGLVEEARR